MKNTEIQNQGKRALYEKPQIEVVLLSVEQGFAASQPFEGGEAHPLTSWSYSWDERVDF